MSFGLGNCWITTRGVNVMVDMIMREIRSVSQMPRPGQKEGFDKHNVATLAILHPPKGLTGLQGGLLVTHSDVWITPGRTSDYCADWKRENCGDAGTRSSETLQVTCSNASGLVALHKADT